MDSLRGYKESMFFKEENWDSEGIPSKIRGRQNRAKSSLRFCNQNSIHPKSKKNWRGLFFSPGKLAEKVHKSRRQDYATKVHLSSKCNEYCDKIVYLLAKYDICVYLSKI